MALTSTFSTRDDFPPADYDQWRKLVEADLAGAPFEKKLITRTYEGIDLLPLYTGLNFAAEQDLMGFPGRPPYVRGSSNVGQAPSAVELQQEFAHPDLGSTNAEIRADLAGGVDSVLLKFDSTVCAGHDCESPSHESCTGLLASTVDDLDAALADVPLDKIRVALDAGAAFLPAAGLLAGLWQRRGVTLTGVRGSFHADPFAALAAQGALPYSAEAALSQLADLAMWAARECPHVTAVAVDTSPYHHAGATAVQDLASSIATGLSYLRTMVDAGLSVDVAARQMVFRFSLGTHHFLALAKLRAARRLWAQVMETCGGSAAAGGMQIQTRTSMRVLTRRDPYVNILRNSASVFAACLAGAQTVTSIPFDSLGGLPGERARRIARNTVLVLQEEGHLGRVADPAGGSWFLDTITEELAQGAWRVFQEIERRGGILAVLSSGWIASEIDAAYSLRAKDIARRKEPITGVSEFPNMLEEPVERVPIDDKALRAAAAERLHASRRGGTVDRISSMAATVAAAFNGASLGQIAAALGFHQQSLQVEPLVLHGFAAPFEELRDAADAWYAHHGARPRVFLANLGSPAHHTARATYAKNFFEAGGFETLTNDGFPDLTAAVKAFAASRAGIAVICSSDKLYPEVVPVAARQLKEAGARTVVLAGNPGENEAAWRAAGVDRFIFIKCDVLATLREMLREEGVLP